MKDTKDILAQVKFEIQKVNRVKPDGSTVINGGSGSPCCCGAPCVPGPPIRHDPLP